MSWAVAEWRTAASRRVPASKMARCMLRLLHRLTDLSRRGNGVVDVTREGLRLLGRLGEIGEHRGNPGGAEPQQIEADVLHGEHTGLEMAGDLRPTTLQIGDGL